MDGDGNVIPVPVKYCSGRFSGLTSNGGANNGGASPNAYGASPSGGGANPNDDGPSHDDGPSRDDGRGPSALLPARDDRPLRQR
jgi:hypothetical protein